MAEAKLKPAYPAVSIESQPETCCKAVLEYQGKRFLTAEAPLLPLDLCDRYADCTCRYRKWDDRRQEERRVGVSGMANQFYHGEEKRENPRGRRETD